MGEYVKRAIHRIVMGSFVISGITVRSYESRKMSVNKLVSFLLGLECDQPGQLTLTLHHGWRLDQRGPTIKPPIRWIKSLERNATFDLSCIVSSKPDGVSYMPGLELSPQSSAQDPHGLFFGSDPEHP